MAVLLANLVEVNKFGGRQANLVGCDYFGGLFQIWWVRKAHGEGENRSHVAGDNESFGLFQWLGGATSFSPVGGSAPTVEREVPNGYYERGSDHSGR